MPALSDKPEEQPPIVEPNDPAVAVPSRPLPLIPGLPARMTSTPVVQVVNRYECSRHCRVLGRLSWNCQTRQDLLILVSMLGTGQAQPFETHEKCLRAVLMNFFPSNAFMAFARSLHTFNCSKKMNCELCKAVYTSIASKALVMDQYTVQ